MEIKLEIKGVKILVIADEEITSWVSHDYSYYISSGFNSYDLKFNLFSSDYDYAKLLKLTAKLYHDDYIVYESKNTRIIDFFKEAISFYNIAKNEIDIYSSDKDYLYEIFYLSFDSLLGEELDKKGWHRLHCLALENSNLATLLLLPPGGGKSTLALKFLDNQKIKVLAEDMVIFKNEEFYGLHLRWGIKDESFAGQGRLMKRKKYQNKILLNIRQFNLANYAKPGNIILGQRISSLESKLEKISKTKLIWPMFKSMVLGLELQQSLAYFLLRNYKDVFLKSKIGWGRLIALANVLLKSRTYVFYIGYDIDRNYNTLNDFLLKE